uniref:Thioredoxin domain containing 9 n=1 Tax=Felis catus TaxID=9685 RepID=A0ABI7W3U9_FELCA
MEANTSVDMFSKVLENQLLQTTKLVEEHLDSEIQKLDQMDEDELERLKEKRLEALRKAQQQKQWKFNGATISEPKEIWNKLHKAGKENYP